MQTSTPKEAPIIHAFDVIKQVSSGTAPLTLLSQLNLSVAVGESLAITGVSGSGKTTLLSLLAGLDVPTSGQIFLAGHEMSTLDEDRRAQVRGAVSSFVFQDFQLLPYLTALENVMLPLEIRNETQAKESAIVYLERVGLAKRMVHKPLALSGGEQQRVALARAFVTQPKVLFADEPTGQLDGHTAQAITELLFELNAEANTTLVLVTHDNTVAQRCHRRYALVDGCLR